MYRVAALDAGRYEALQAVEAALQLFHGSRVRNANVIIGAEGFARNHRDEFLRQQFFGELQRVSDAVLESRAHVFGYNYELQQREGGA